MTEWTPDEHRLIAECAVDLEVGYARLREAFGGRGLDVLIEAAREAGKLSEALYNGESIDLGDGQFLARDAPDFDGTSGRVVERLDRDDDRATEG